MANEDRDHSDQDNHFTFNIIGITQAVLYLIAVILSIIVAVELGETVVR